MLHMPEDIALHEIITQRKTADMCSLSYVEVKKVDLSINWSLVYVEKNGEEGGDEKLANYKIKVFHHERLNRMERTYPILVFYAFLIFY